MTPEEATGRRLQVHPRTPEKYGRLTPIGQPFTVSQYGKNRKYRHTYVVCECECGNVCTPRLERLVRGISKSCGCAAIDAMVEKNTTHCMSRKSETKRVYGIWVGMRLRCRNKKSHAYSLYGGRGISVCSRWDGPDGFANFLKDMGQPPSQKHSIDRIDPNGNYCHENCRWATVVQQARNKRGFKKYLHEGESLTLAELADRSSVSKATILARLNRGWPIARAVDEKVSSKNGR